MNIRDHLPLLEAPESVWEAIEAGLRENNRRVARPRAWVFIFAAAAAVVLLVAGGEWWFAARRTGWIETAASAGITLRIGDIGSVDVRPGTRLRVIADRADQHRLQLVRGSIHAKISAPPRLFQVETRSGTAVDLGCEYSMTMDEDGSGILHVSAGWVDFERDGLESLVPAGAMCRIRPGKGADIPYFEDASLEFGHAVERGDIEFLIRNARVRDTLTLWHLLSRVPANGRARVYDRITALAPIPPAISRDRVLSLDSEALQRLREELAWKW